jgi:23S rRNA (guanosine2251-2'-O)-methyltransferase
VKKPGKVKTVEEQKKTQDQFIIGKNPLLEALKAGRPINKILLAQGLNPAFVKEISQLAKERNIPYQFVERKKLDLLAGKRLHQGVMAQTGVKEYVEWEELLARAARRGEDPLLLILDNLEDPHNLGAVLRTADAVGAHGVIISKHRSVPLTAGVARASAGAVEHVPVARVTNLATTLEQLKEKGVWIVGAEAGAKQFYFQADLKGPLAVVLGSEGKGMSRLVRAKCDFLVGIPMLGQVNSLNVSVAGALLLYEAARQRGKFGGGESRRS